MPLPERLSAHQKVLNGIGNTSSAEKLVSLGAFCDVVEISSKDLKETIVRVLEFLSQETSLRSRRLKQKFPFNNLISV